MSILVTKEEKQNILRWFMGNFKFSKKEMILFMNYLVSNPDRLERVHFVDDVRFCPRSVLLASTCGSEIPFRYYRNHLMTTDVERCFHDLRLFPEENVYMKLLFKGSNTSAQLVPFLVDNPFLSTNVVEQMKEQEEIDALLHHVLLQTEKEELKRRIDKALDVKDKEEFHRLLEQLNLLSN